MLSNDFGRSMRRLAAIGSALVFVVGCGIAGQSPSPRVSTAASQPPQVSSAPTGAATRSPATATISPGATASATAAPTDAPPATPAPTPAGQVVFGNWPLYIDIDEETGGYPTLEAFTERTGIQVSYQEDINDNEEFFGVIQPDLAAGNSTGYDIITVTDWLIERMVRLGYLQPLDKSLLPNFTANANDLFTDSWYDPGNQYSIPYVGGIVGIAYNPTLTGRPITTFDDLLDPAFAGRVGMFSEMRDTMSLTLLSMGVVPEEATIEDAQAAHDKLLAPAQAGQFRNFYGNDYYDALAAGDLAVSIAWGGDISQMRLYDNPDVEFIIPDTGGMFYTDNMAIPINAEHPTDAHMLMDSWYDLDSAAPLIEYVGYFSPVNGITERVLEDSAAARAEGDEEWADQLEVIANDVVPNDEQLQNVYTYKILTEDEERQWNDLFNEVVTG